MKTIQLKAIFALFLLLGTTGSLWSQQVSLFNQNIANPFSINPSQAGMDESKIFFQHRRQWIGIQGAPEKTLFTSEWRLDKSKTAIGFTLGRDQSSIIANTSGYATVATHFDLSDAHHLSFGASAGVRHNSIDFGRVNVHDAGDALLFNDRQNSTNFDARFGLTYRFRKLEVQASALQLFGNKSTYDNNFDQKHLEYTFVRHFIGRVGYQFGLTESIGLQPIVQVKGIQGAPFQLEGILKFDFKNNIWAAAHYVHGSAAAGSFGMTINDKYILGYSAEFSTNRLANYNAGTHELLVGIKLGSAFKNDNSKRSLDKMERSLKTYDERQQYLEEENRKMQAEIDRQRKRIKELQQQSPDLNYAEIRKILKEETEKLLAEKGTVAPPAPAPAPAPSTQVNESDFQAATQPYYVVIATAKSPRKAIKAVRKAEKSFALGSYIVHPVNSNFYYIVTGGFDAREAARQEMIKVFKAGTEKELNGKPWIFENQ